MTIGPAELAAAAGETGDASAAASRASAALSAAAVTVVSGACDGPLAGARVHLRGGSVRDWDAIVAALAADGITAQVCPVTSSRTQ